MAVPENVRTFTEAALEGLRLQTAAHAGSWGLDTALDWSIDQDKQYIAWTLKDGRTAKAPVQIVGTFNPKDCSFLWAWGHPSSEEPLQEAAKLARAYGEANGDDRFTQRKVIVTEDEAWELTAVACRVAEANGAYRADAGGPLVFVTFGEVEIGKP